MFVGCVFVQAAQADLMVAHWLKSNSRKSVSAKNQKHCFGLVWEHGSRSYTVRDGCPNLQRALNKVLGNPMLFG